MISNWIPIEVRANQFSPLWWKILAIAIVYAQFFGLIALITLVARLVWNA